MARAPARSCARRSTPCSGPASRHIRSLNFTRAWKKLDPSQRNIAGDGDDARYRRHDFMRTPDAKAFARLSGIAPEPAPRRRTRAVARRGRIAGKDARRRCLRGDIQFADDRCFTDDMSRRSTTILRTLPANGWSRTFGRPSAGHARSGRDSPARESSNSWGHRRREVPRSGASPGMDRARRPAWSSSDALDPPVHGDARAGSARQAGNAIAPRRRCRPAARSCRAGDADPRSFTRSRRVDPPAPRWLALALGEAVPRRACSSWPTAARVDPCASAKDATL